MVCPLGGKDRSVSQGKIRICAACLETNSGWPEFREASPACTGVVFAKRSRMVGNAHRPFGSSRTDAGGFRSASLPGRVIPPAGGGADLRCGGSQCASVASDISDHAGAGFQSAVRLACYFRFSLSGFVGLAGCIVGFPKGRSAPPRFELPVLAEGAYSMKRASAS